MAAIRPPPHARGAVPMTEVAADPTTYQLFITDR